MSGQKQTEDRRAPPKSNRGCMKYSPSLKKLRDVADTEPEEGYFRFLWQGYDSIQECFNVRLNDEFLKTLDDKFNQAKQLQCPVTIPFKMGRTEFQVCDYASKGFRYLIQCDDFMIMIANPEKEWSVSVRYLSGGLCEWGAAVLRQSVRRILSYISVPNCEDWERLSRVDVATDFYSKRFLECLRPSILDGLVVPSRSKVRQDEMLSFYIQEGRFDTLTIGTKNSLQLQVYDKAKEIRQSSGKTYFYKLWGMEAKKDVYRFEIRFFSEFLRNRSILTFEDFETYRNELISEAMNIRRLTVPNWNDKNRSRWAYHPLYTFVRRCFCCENFGVCTGRYVTGRRSDLSEKGIKRIAGDVLSLSVLRNRGIYADRSVAVVMRLVLRSLEQDERLPDKVERSRERYKYVDCAA